MRTRNCSRNGCTDPAVATLTYVYAESTAVIGPLGATPEPHTYDLCERHARTLTAPRGWELVRPEGGFVPTPVVPRPAPGCDDLFALAEAVREGPRRPTPTSSMPAPSMPAFVPGRPARRRGHLRAVPPLS